jgi:hypothetical protein
VCVPVNYPSSSIVSGHTRARVSVGFVTEMRPRVADGDDGEGRQRNPNCCGQLGKGKEGKLNVADVAEGYQFDMIRN